MQHCFFIHIGLQKQQLCIKPQKDSFKLFIFYIPYSHYKSYFKEDSEYEESISEYEDK